MLSVVLTGTKKLSIVNHSTLICWVRQTRVSLTHNFNITIRPFLSYQNVNKLFIQLYSHRWTFSISKTRLFFSCRRSTYLLNQFAAGCTIFSKILINYDYFNTMTFKGLCCDQILSIASKNTDMLLSSFYFHFYFYASLVKSKQNALIYNKYTYI